MVPHAQRSAVACYTSNPRLRDISFRVAAGETLALLGRSDCGKTTTGKAIVQMLRGLALVQDRPLLDGQGLLPMQDAALQATRR